jgi:predicted DNA binding CopG/RHH family protein
MKSKNKQEKDKELRGTLSETNHTKKNRKIAKETLKKAKKLENRIKESGGTWVKTFKGYKLIKL